MNAHTAILKHWKLGDTDEAAAARARIAACVDTATRAMGNNSISQDAYAILATVEFLGARFYADDSCSEEETLERRRIINGLVQLYARIVSMESKRGRGNARG
jgi:hypothetical protein